MGLEFAEFILDVEEQYAINFQDDDITSLKTFGGLVELIKRKIDEPLSFESIDTSYEVILSVLIAQLRPLLPKDMNVDENTPLKVFTPYAKRYDTWSEIQKRFPELPTWKSINFRRIYFLKDWRLYMGFVVLIASWVIVFSIMPKGKIDFWSFHGLGTMLFCLGTGVLWMFFCVCRLPYRTVGDVAREIVGPRQKRLRSMELSMTDLENELRALINKHYGIKPDKIRPESDLFKDLKLG